MHFSHSIKVKRVRNIGRAHANSSSSSRADHLRGLQAERFFSDYELQKIEAWLSVVAARNPNCWVMKEECF